MNPFVRSWRIAIILLILIPLTSGLAAPPQQTVTSADLATELLKQLTPEERVGQLFLVTFNGPEAGPTTDIYKLINDYHIGGVVIRAANDNFLAHDQTLPVLLALNRQLQTAEYSSAQQLHTDPVSGSTFRPAFIPLFIGVSQEGDGYPYDQILSSSLTQLPSEMAVGATWKPELAQKMGEVLGRELSSLGINLLLGPSLDVLDKPQSEGAGDLGVRTFGGDPFWVGEMGRAYITGVHQGSGGEMAVIGKHFPGYGSSARLPEEEVVTVPKSLEQLKLIELYPFFAVTGNAPSAEASVDGLLTSHIRYRGLLGNYRSINKPVSLDPDAFDKFMTLEPFTNWRANGGVMVSDELGARAIRRFYESSGQVFNTRFVARDAFYAGNDLLYLGNIIQEGDPDSLTSIIRILDYFTQKYREDNTFAQRVDASVLRILTLKFRLYGNSFTLNAVRASQNLPREVGNSGDVTAEIIQQAATLLSPNPDELNNTIPAPPGRNDHIVFVTDVRSGQQCSMCPLQNIIKQDALEQVVVRLYSPQSGGEILPSNLISYSYANLQEMLDVGSGIVQIENDLRQASWIVFVMLDQDLDDPASTAMRRFLAERPDLLQQKKIVAFAFNTPYSLDATDVAKLSAYYALYSKTTESFEVAARLLMQEARPTGYLPVTVSGVGYDLNQRLFPDPSQTILLELDIQQAVTPTLETTPESGSLPTYKIGDNIPVRTGVILDYNGHIVPDGTLVQFRITYGEGGIPKQIESSTIKGSTKATIRVEQAGLLIIEAMSESARSGRLEFEILSEEGEVVLPTPTQEPTHTPTPTNTVTVTPTLSPTPTPIPVEEENHLGDWFIALFITIGFALAIYWISSIMGQVRWGVRGAFLALIGGLLTYCYLAAGMPGSEALAERGGTLGVSLVILFGSAVGWSASVGWRTLQRKKV